MLLKITNMDFGAQLYKYCIKAKLQKAEELALW